MRSCLADLFEPLLRRNDINRDIIKEIIIV